MHADIKRTSWQAVEDAKVNAGSSKEKALVPLQAVLPVANGFAIVLTGAVLDAVLANPTTFT
jgi:hypothetical protein